MVYETSPHRICIISEPYLYRIWVMSESYLGHIFVVYALHLCDSCIAYESLYVCLICIECRTHLYRICIVVSHSRVVSHLFLYPICIISTLRLIHSWVVSEWYQYRIWVMHATYPRENCNSSASYVRQICNVSESYLRRKFLISTRVISVSYRRISVYFLWLTSPQSFLSLLLIWTDLNARSAVKGSEGLAGRRKKGRLSLLLSFFPSSVALLSVTLLAFYCPRAIRDQWGLVSFYHTVS